MIMVDECRGISGSKKCTVLVSGVDHGGSNAWGGEGQRVNGKSLYLPLNFVINLKQL